MSRDLETQRADKAARIARAVGMAPDKVVPSPRGWGYRARIRLGFDPEGRPAYSRPRSHERFAVPNCAIARAEINEALAAFRAEVPRANGADWIEFRSDGSRVVVALGGKPARGRLPFEIGALPHVSWNGRKIRGQPTLEIEVEGIRHRLRPGTFYQVNLEANAVLVHDVVSEVLRLEPNSVLDVFSGAGNLSLPLAARGIPVTLLEKDRVALDDARATAQRHELQITTRRLDARGVRAGDVFFDVALLDPPRAGAGKELIEALTVTRPRALVYVSCNPTTLGRDVALAARRGYQIRTLRGYDFFPHTPHVETLCVLERTS